MRVSPYFFGVPLAIMLAFPALRGQTQIVRSDFFPAELEFPELRKVQAEENIKDAASLARVKDGALFGDAGFEQYSRRVYELAPAASLSVEVVNLKDTKAAYSLLTLLRKVSTTLAGEASKGVPSARG